MSVADKLAKLSNDIIAAYEAVEEKGGIVPEHKNTDNLPDAIDSIESGGADPTFFGCESVEEMNYLENIMREDLLNLTYKGELKWA